MVTRYFILLSACVFGFLANAQNASAPANNPNAQYHLSSGDTVSVSVFGEPDLALSQRIDGQGKIVMPLLGEVVLDGLTLREAEVMLEKRYIDEEFLNKPEVTVQIISYKTRTFTIFGQVRGPGTKEFPPDRASISLIQAISMAGDFTDFARTSAVLIKRRHSDGRQISFEVDARSLITGEASQTGAEDVMVLPDDQIFVPERGPLGR